VSKGGNLLLNVGPTARGAFDSRATDRLDAMGEWMKYNNRSIYGCTEAPAGIKAPANTLLTYNPLTKRLYVHLLAYPMGRLTLTEMGDKVKYVQFLHDASEVRFTAGRESEKNDINLNLPVQKPPVEIPVLEIYLK
jgi:alpha-L-fucosidase